MINRKVRPKLDFIPVMLHEHATADVTVRDTAARVLFEFGWTGAACSRLAHSYNSSASIELPKTRHAAVKQGKTKKPRV